MGDGTNLAEPAIEAVLAGALADLEAAAIQRLAGESEVVEVPPGGTVAHEGDPADAMYVVAGGRVQLSIHQRETDLPLATVAEGELLGWSWMVPPHRWSFDATSGGGATLVRIPADALDSLMAEDAVAGGALSRTMAAMLSRRLRDTRVQLLDLFARAGSGPVG